MPLPAHRRRLRLHVDDTRVLLLTLAHDEASIIEVVEVLESRDTRNRRPASLRAAANERNLTWGHRCAFRSRRPAGGPRRYALRALMRAKQGFMRCVTARSTIILQLEAKFTLLDGQKCIGNRRSPSSPNLRVHQGDMPPRRRRPRLDAPAHLEQKA